MEKLVLIASRAASYAADYALFWSLLFFAGRFGVYGYIASLLLFFIYRYVMTAMMGRTVGMMLLKLVLNRYGFRICLKREIARFASALYFIGYIYAIVDKHSRTMHDIFSGTCVVFVRKEHSADAEQTKEAKDNKKSATSSSKMDNIIKPVVVLMLFVSISKWLTGFILNDIGNIGLKKVAESREYYQSFDGDNLLSLSQNELYLQTLGRRYTAVVDIDQVPVLIRLSNKLDHSEIYSLQFSGAKIGGKLLYKVPTSFQYIGSGRFRTQRELCGISPKRNVILLDQKGNYFAQTTAKLKNIIMVKCGDIDKDKKAEIVLLGRSGDIEIIKLKAGKLVSIFLGKPGDDVGISALLLDGGLTVVTVQNSESQLYQYQFVSGSFRLISEKQFDVSEPGQVDYFDDVDEYDDKHKEVIVSNIRRNNMTFRVGELQKLEIYSASKENGATTSYEKSVDFGGRPSRTYAFKVRNLEELVDIDRDGDNELLLKAVGKDDVMGNRYTLEVYKINKTMLKLNRLLVKIQRVLNTGAGD